jgi:hypothetical protein
VFKIAPQGHQHPPRQRNNAHPAHALAPLAKRREYHWLSALCG